MSGEALKEKDRCVLCGEETEYDKDTHIDCRKYYVEGFGQLCPSCHKMVYRGVI